MFWGMQLLRKLQSKNDETQCSWINIQGKVEFDERFTRGGMQFVFGGRTPNIDTPAHKHKWPDIDLLFPKFLPPTPIFPSTRR